MPSWNEVVNEIRVSGSTFDVVRRRYLAVLNSYTKRNVIAYYSGWLQKANIAQRGVSGFEVNDADKNGFMSTVYQLDRKLGLDLILHTPGGDFAATESLVNYLRAMFGTDIRAIVPQIAMSAGTMIALSCKEIVMGKHSSLGPIDPQFGGLPAHGILEEYKHAVAEIQANQASVPLWQVIFSKYNPTLLGECQKAIDWSAQAVTSWLETGMFKGQADAKQKAKKIVDELGSHLLTKSHARHISLEGARDLGVAVSELETDDQLQDAVLSVHHAFVQTLTETGAIKIIENHNGIAFIAGINPGQMISGQQIF